MRKKNLKKKKYSLSSSFRPLLWSYDFSRVDTERNKKAIIINAINYGDLSHWKELVGMYGKSEIKNTLTSIPATSLRPQAKRLASLIFNIKDFNYALRGARRKR